MNPFKLIRDLIAALNRHSDQLEKWREFTGDMEDAAYELRQAAWEFQDAFDKLEGAVDKLDSLKVDSEVSTN